MKYEDFDKNPLPDHTRIDYYECLAKIALEVMFPNDFSDLEIKDKPDLQNIKTGVGIEVTRAINPKQEQNEKLFNKISYGQVRNKERAIEKINSSYTTHSITISGKRIKEPDRYYDGTLLGIPDNDSFDRVIEAYKSKIIKLNGDGFRTFLNNYLFVHSEILADQQMIDEAILKMIGYKQNFEKTFQRVFVYVPEYMYVLDLEKKIGEISHIKEYQFNWGKQARKMVIQYEVEK